MSENSSLVALRSSRFTKMYANENQPLSIRDETPCNFLIRLNPVASIVISIVGGWFQNLAKPINRLVFRNYRPVYGRDRNGDRYRAIDLTVGY